MKHARGRRTTGTRTSPARRWRWTAAALVSAVAATFAMTAPTAGTATAAPAQEEAASVQEAKQKKYRATRPVVADSQTGQARMPTDAEVEQLVATLSTLTNRPSAGLPEAAGAGGAVTVDLESGFAGVMLARLNEDGTYETRCVFTLEEGAEFMGLVEAQ